VSLAIARNGSEEECFLGALIVLVVLAGCVVWKRRRPYRMQMKAFDQELRRICEMRRDDERG
jgi:hypothetical protein